MPHFLLRALSTSLFLTILISFGTAQSSDKATAIKNCEVLSKEAFKKKAVQYKTNLGVESTIQSMYPLDKYKLIEGIVTKNSSLAVESIQSNQGKYVLHFGILLLLLLLMIVLVPLLLCTKCCQCCCRRSINSPYSSCQIKWPLACMMVLLLALMGICIVTVVLNSNYQPQFNDFKCSLSIMSDDVINGGTSQSNKISFMGLNEYLGIAKNFIVNASSTKRVLESSLNPKTQNLAMLNLYAGAVVQDISHIPSLNGSELPLMYPKPLTSKNPIMLQKSLFAAILGTNISSNSLVSNLTASVVMLNSSVGLISRWSNNLTTILKGIDQKTLLAGVNQKIRSVEDLEFNIQSTIGIIEKGIAQVYVIGSYVLLGCTIFLSLVIFIQAACLCCQNHSCRPKLTFCCALLWVLGLLFFVVALGCTAANPAVVYGCQYLREGFSSETGYKKNIGKFFKDENEIIVIVGKCLASSNEPYYLYQKLSVQNHPNVTQLSNYPLSPLPSLPELGEKASQNFSTTIKAIEDYRTARILDIDDSSMIQEIKYLGKSQQCFPDTWIPSLHQSPSLINCSSNITADNLSCFNSDAFMERREGCVGCMDTFLVLERFTNQFDLTTQLQNRYPDCVSKGRQIVVENLTMVWRNFYKLKKQKIGVVKQRALKAESSFNQSRKIIQNKLLPNLKIVENWLKTQTILKESLHNTSQNSVTNQSATTLQKSFKQKMDCRIMGSDIELSINIFCSAGVIYLYNLRNLYTAAAIIIFFICIFASCSISRSSHQVKTQEHHLVDEQHKEEKLNDELRAKPTTERKIIEEVYFY